MMNKHGEIVSLIVKLLRAVKLFFVVSLSNDSSVGSKHVINIRVAHAFNSA